MSVSVGTIRRYIGTLTNDPQLDRLQDVNDDTGTAVNPLGLLISAAVHEVNRRVPEGVYTREITLNTKSGRWQYPLPTYKDVSADGPTYAAAETWWTTDAFMGLTTANEVFYLQGGTDYKQLRPLSKYEFETYMKQDAPIKTGTPLYYTVFQGANPTDDPAAAGPPVYAGQPASTWNMGIAPQPVAVYAIKIRYKAAFPAITGSTTDATLLELDDDLAWVVAYKAAVAYFMNLQQYDAANEMKLEHRKALSRAIQAYAMKGQMPSYRKVLSNGAFRADVNSRATSKRGDTSDPLDME